MKIDRDYKFTLNISNEGYEKKSDAICCLSSAGAKAINRKKMCFFENSVNVDEFLNKAQSGYSFCALYRFDNDTKYWYTNKKGQRYLGYPHYQKSTETATKGGLKIDFKRDEYFSGSQVIFIDIDFTKYTDINEYIDKLTFKPTCIYMSYSDNIEKHGIISRRFHLCYVFNNILDKDTFKYCSITLSEALVKDTNEELDDKCGEKMSQYMNGCYGNKENYKTYSIYSIEDIHEYNRNNNVVEEDTEVDTRTTTLNDEMEKDQAQQETLKIEENTNESIFDDRLLNDWDRLEQTEFLKLRDWENYRRKTKYIYRVENNEWINGVYQKVDDDYFSLFYKSHNVDGEGRRKSLFQRMCLRKLINPDITPMDLVVNTIIDIVRFYDNSDNVLNSDYIKRNVNNCLEMSLEDIKTKYKGELEYLRNTTKPKRGIIYYSRKVHTKETTYLILDELYNRNITVNDNLFYLNEICEFKIEKSTIYNYLKDRGIKSNTKKLTDDEIISLIDYSKSCVENYNILKSNNYIIGDKRFRKLYKDNKNKISEVVDTDRCTTLNSKMEKDQIKDNWLISLDNCKSFNQILNNIENGNTINNLNYSIHSPLWSIHV